MKKRVEVCSISSVMSVWMSGSVCKGEKWKLMTCRQLRKNKSRHLKTQGPPPGLSHLQSSRYSQSSRLCICFINTQIESICLGSDIIHTSVCITTNEPLIHAITVCPCDLCKFGINLNWTVFRGADLEKPWLFDPWHRINCIAEVA